MLDTREIASGILELFGSSSPDDTRHYGAAGQAAYDKLRKCWVFFPHTEHLAVDLEAEADAVLACIGKGPVWE